MSTTTTVPTMGVVEKATDWLEHAVYLQCRTLHDGSSTEVADQHANAAVAAREVLLQTIRELVDREVELAVKAERRRARQATTSPFPTT